MPREGQTGTLPDGTPVIYLGGKIRKANEAGMAELGGGFYESPQGQKYRQGPKGGFAKIGGPTDSTIDQYAQRGKKTNDALGLLDQFDKSLRDIQTGPLGWVKNPNSLATASGLGNQLMLSLKEEPYNLGVLNGPDLDILQKVISNPESLKDAAFRKAVYPRLQNIAAQLGRSYRNDGGALRGVGGRPETTVPNLYRAPDSQYTAEQWGTEGSVPANVFKGTSGPNMPGRQKSAPRAATQGAVQEWTYDANGKRVK